MLVINKKGSKYVNLAVFVLKLVINLRYIKVCAGLSGEC